MLKVRVILDTEEDVIRTIKVSEKYNLEQLHEFIAKSFGFSGLEMASFYRTDDEWNQGEEIPLFDMSDSNTGITMKNFDLDSIFTSVGSKLIYIYDFMNMWAFYVELVEIEDSEGNWTVAKVAAITGGGEFVQKVSSNTMACTQTLRQAHCRYE